MVCDICGKEGARIRHVTRSDGKADDLLVIENVPVISCPHCGESYLTAETLHEIERIKLHRQNFAAKRPVAVAKLRMKAGEHKLRINSNSGRLGMFTSEPKAGERVKDVHFSEDTISVDLVDGRTITVPLAWYPRLLHATVDQRTNWRIAGGGYGIHWPDIDEDLSTQGLLRGAPAPRASGSAAA
jgi:YgiT-type zinc finger domain-containing protein